MRPLILAIALSLASCSQTPVMAQSAISEVVLQTIAMESANQSALGQQLVAHVIINRAVVSHKSLVAICKQPKQFSCWNSPSKAKAWLDRHYTPKARQNARNALETAFKTRAYPAIRHYHAKSVRPYWAKGHKPTVVWGDHLFYGGIK